MTLFASGAQAQTCSVTTPPSWFWVTVDIVPNTGVTVSGVEIRYSCSRFTPFTSVRVCAYIRASGNQVGPSDYTYYQTKDTDPRLAWQMKENFNRLYARDGGGVQSTRRLP